MPHGIDRKEFVAALGSIYPTGYTRRMEKLRLTDKSRENAEKQGEWKLMDQFSEARDEVRGTEDAFLVTEHCVAVLDGVSTPKNPKSVDGETPAQFAIRIAIDALRSATDLKAEDAAVFLTERLREAVAQTEVPGNPSFVCVLFFPKQNRIVRIGDCSYLLDGVGYNPGIPPDVRRAAIRKHAIERARADGVSDEELVEHDPVSARAQELREWQNQYANNPDAPEWGYAVVDGRDIPEQYVEHISVPVEAKSIVLASDGYPPSTLRNSLQETETALQTVERTDPLGIAERSIHAMKPKKGHAAADDRTYLRVTR